MLLFADLSYRMKDNARTFFMVAIISTVAFSAIGTLYGLQAYITSITEAVSPNSFNYQVDSDEEDTVAEDVSLIEQTLADNGVETNVAQAILPVHTVEGESTLIVTESVYNQFALLLDEEPLSLKKEEVVVGVVEKFRTDLADSLLHLPLTLTGEEVTFPTKIISSHVFGVINGYYVIPDSMSDQVMNEKVDEITYYAWQATSGEEAERMAVGKQLSEQIDPWKWSAVEYEVYSIKQANGHLLFIGLFIGIVFFVCAGSFLYFRLYSDLDDDKQKFKAIAKMGLTEKELENVLNRQITLLFFAPIAVALIHGFVALNALSNAFQYHLIKETSIVLGIFFVIQLIYFFVVRFFYTKQIKEAIY